MKKFVLGFITCWFFIKYRPPQIIKYLQETTAKLELKQDILKHDHPNFG